MDQWEVVQGIIAFLLGGWGWYMKRTLDQLDERHHIVTKEIATIKEDYIRKEDFKEFKVEIRDMFKEIKQDIKDLKTHE